MLNKISHYKDLVEKSYSISNPLLLQTAAESITSEKNQLLLDLSSEKGIKVPVVGDFDAGKSSLINAFIGRHNLLPTAITPETAVAYEMYYSENEKIVQIREDNEVDSKAIDEIKSLNTKPGDVVRVYVNSTVIKNLNDKGIVLVDMPGLGSGVEAHNNAILHYMTKGCSFVFVVDCEAGTISHSTLSFMHELSQYNLKCGVVISKIDKKPASEIPALKEVIAYNVKRATNSDVYVGAVSSADNNIGDFVSFMNSLDSEALIAEKYAKKVIGFVDNQLFSIKSQVDMLNANIQDVDAKLKELEEQKQKLQKELDSNPGNAETPEKSTDDILLNVRNALFANTDELANAIADKQSAEEIKSMMLSVIRPAIVTSFKEEGEQYAAAMNTVVDDLSESLQDSLQIDEGLVKELVDDFREDILGWVDGIASALLAMPHIFAKILGGILALFGDLIPDLIGWIFGKSKDDVIIEVIQKLRDEVIPLVCAKLKPVLFEQVKAQQERIRKSITDSVTGKLTQLQENVKSSAEQQSKEELESKKSILMNALNELQTIKVTI